MRRAFAQLPVEHFGCELLNPAAQDGDGGCGKRVLDVESARLRERAGD